MKRGLVLALLACTALALVSGAAGALAGSAGPVAVTVSPSADGRTVSIHASAPAGTQIFELKAHLCVPGAKIHTNYDFGFQGQKCPNVALGGGDAEKVAAFPSGVASADLNGFRVGSGRVHWVNELGYDQTITCDATHPCAVVVRVQITNDTVFFTAPVCYTSPCSVPNALVVPPPAAAAPPVAPRSVAAEPNGSSSSRAAATPKAATSNAAKPAARSGATVHAARKPTTVVAAPAPSNTSSTTLPAALAGAIAAAWITLIIVRRDALLLSQFRRLRTL